MRSVIVEMSNIDGEKALEALEAVGAKRLEGFKPIPMESSINSSVVLTVEIPDEETLDKIVALPDVVEVYEDPQAAPFLT